MLKIIRVGALDNNKLDVELSNGSLILLDLQKLMGDPQYASLLEDDRILYPKTDGKQVYWLGGPSLTLEHLMEIVQMP